MGCGNGWKAGFGLESRFGLGAGLELEDKVGAARQGLAWTPGLGLESWFWPGERRAWAGCGLETSLCWKTGVWLECLATHTACLCTPIQPRRAFSRKPPTANCSNWVFFATSRLTDSEKYTDAVTRTTSENSRILDNLLHKALGDSVLELDGRGPSDSVASVRSG